ncbi:DapH/DapD/GlmU-related protein [Christiangramia portivictoriae]|uniref:DapH/DapD/GlmU-related protein n=1 Tax=Christiangramia portivictoriae TaxID=326069 RepID=UPI00042736F6|nr:DapH/DapD/GlmU-related protein [Christiangramia portivictoriae]
MYSSIQILGFGPYYIPVLYDLIRQNRISDNIEVFKNLPSVVKPIINTKPFDLVIHEGELVLNKESPCVFGVSGGNNKHGVFDYFQKKFDVTEQAYISLIDNSCSIALSTEIGLGCVFEQNISVSAQTKVGFGVSVKRGVSIGHHCVIGNFVDINPGTTVAGKVEIGHGTIIGAGSVILDGVQIGENSIIGAGSIVTKNIPSNVIAYGSPCKVVRENEV